MQIEILVERLIARRRDLGITQSEAAKLIGVSQPAYQRYEAGIRTPSVQVTREIANALNTSVDYLTGYSDQTDSDCIAVSKNESPELFAIVKQCKNLSKENLNRLQEYLNELK